MDGDQHRSHLAIDGRRTGLQLDGLTLEAQLALDDGSALLLLTENSPYEEGLHVYLLSPRGTVEDALEAGAAFSPGILELRGAGSDWVDLRFFRNDLVYHVEVGRRPQLRLRLPAGWKYKRRFALHRLMVAARKGETDG
jgi:hypothetical protein